MPDGVFGGWRPANTVARVDTHSARFLRTTGSCAGMFGTADEKARRHRSVLAAVLMVLLVVVSAFGILGVSLAPARAPAARLTAQGTFSVSLSFSPNPVPAGTQTQISLSFTSGGSSPFTVWVNGSAPGCAPPTQPFSTPNYTNNFPCTPASSGSYNVHLDAIDSSGYRRPAANPLTGNTGNGGCTSHFGGSGSGNSRRGRGVALTGILRPAHFDVLIVLFFRPLLPPRGLLSLA